MPQTVQKWRPAAGWCSTPVIEASELTQQFPLGAVIDMQSAEVGMGKAIYLQGVASTVVGSWVTFSPDDWTTALLVPGAQGQVGIALSANVAGQFGFYQVFGKAIGRAATGYVDNALVYATAGAGVVDDAVVAGDRVKNAFGASAVADGLADFDLQYPHMDDGAAA